MPESFYDRTPATSSFIDHFWHMRESHDGSYPLYTTVQWGFVFSDYNGMQSAWLIGPRTQPATMPFRAGEYFWGMVVNAEVNLVGYSKHDLLNRIIALSVTNSSLTLAGRTYDTPTYATLNAFTHELIKNAALYAAPIAAVSHRDKQRKLKYFTGLTPKQIEQARRVEQAIDIINAPRSLADIALEVGFADQAHMTRDFRRLVGHSPAEIREMFKNET